ncbi:hypothetical protein GQ43DRAFT_445404 [Delitschia confertaspora ATCC 74209]|uniref:Serine hydrolase domain-containing protein n=1 Tax=Delitschia confertaspora ATCC 74209 TaxID=1513339 RepID=A0A9P4MQM0_9PLEO|nr:hypothetical protein GQ43DRAFT_445404 [Delitschia confertaspora ATCC 74209]
MASPETNPSLPTLLAFHGSGSNATCHTVQLARLNRLLRPHFNIIALEAPFASAAGPGILPFFEGCGPFKRWVPMMEGPQDKRTGVMSTDVEELVKEAVQEVEGEGGKVVGCIGFSQGTRVVAGLLKAREVYLQLKAQGKLPPPARQSLAYLGAFKFGISVCGSYPPPLLPESLRCYFSPREIEELEAYEEKIRSPTIHVLGKLDEWEWAGKLLIETCYEIGEEKSVVKECEMGHQYPIAAEENEGMRDWILETHAKLDGA